MKLEYLIIAVLVVLLMLNRCGKEKPNNLAEYNVAEIEKYRDEYGREVSKRMSAEAGYKDLLTKTDSLTRELVAYAGKKASAGTKVITVTEYDTILVDNEIIRYDTLDSLVYPVYQREVKDKWYNAQLTMGFDTTRLQLSIHNEYDIIHKKEKGRSIVEIRNLNPHTTTREVRSFTLDGKRKRISIGPGVGVGVDGGLKPTFSVGLFLTYSLFRF